jgi:hypothetical protein
MFARPTTMESHRLKKLAPHCRVERLCGCPVIYYFALGLLLASKRYGYGLPNGEGRNITANHRHVCYSRCLGLSKASVDASFRPCGFKMTHYRMRDGIDIFR